MLHVGHLLESADEYIEWHNVPRAWKEMSMHVIPYVVVCVVTVLLCCPLFYYCIVHSSVNIAQHSNNTVLFTVHWVNSGQHYSSAYDKDWKLSGHPFSFGASNKFPLIMYRKFVWPNSIWPHICLIWPENVNGEVCCLLLCSHCIVTVLSTAHCFTVVCM